MAFLKNGLSLAGRFLDGLDSKAEGGSGLGEGGEAGAPDRPTFQRRSASSSQNLAGDGGLGIAATPSPARRHVSTGSSHSSAGGFLEGGREAASGGRRGEGGAFTVTDAGEAGEGVPPYAPSDADGVGHAGVVGEDAEGGAALDGSPPRRSRRGSHEPDSATAAALLAAVQEKDAKILKLISQNDELRRQNKDLSADVDDFEAELARVTAERDRAKKKEDSLEKQIKDAYSEAAAARARLETLEQELVKHNPGFTTQLECSVESLQTEVARLKDQLSQAEATRAVTQEQMTSLRIAAQRREDELMTENKELAALLGAAELAVQTSSSGAPSTHIAAVEAELEAHMRREAATAAESAMLAERRLSSDRLRQVEQLTQQLSVAHEGLDKAKAELLAVRTEREATVTRLREELAVASAALKENRTAQLEARLTTLADSLLEKQGHIDVLISEKSSLNQRLELERQRRRVAEEHLTSLQAKAAAHDGEGDVEEGVFTTPNSRPRRHRTTTPLTRIQALNKNPTVAQATETVDRFCLQTGRFLGVNPYARLLCFLYLLLLHLWALFILSFHTHQLEGGGGPVTGPGTIISPAGQVLN